MKISDDRMITVESEPWMKLRRYFLLILGGPAHINYQERRDLNASTVNQAKDLPLRAPSPHAIPLCALNGHGAATFSKAPPNAP